MSSNIFTPKNVIVQGITGTHGAFHTNAMLSIGTPIVAGTSPNKAGSTVHNVPVFSSIASIKEAHPAIDATVIFVPAPFAKGAIMEAIDAEIPLIVCITEGIAVHDMLLIHQRLKNSSSRLIGPNCPGIATPGEVSMGIIPAHITKPGSVGVISRSGTLTYEVVAALTRAGIGQRYIVGIGGDPIKGTDFTDCLELFMADDTVTSIVVIGEIGGQSELHAADYIKKYGTKPVVGYIAGRHAPEGVQLGHAGAIFGSEAESAEAKTTVLADAGAHMVNDISAITPKLIKILEEGTL